jgi:hypothetical protein
MNRLMLAILVSTLICLAAWIPAALAEQFGYAQFAVAWIATGICLGTVAIGLCPPRYRRTLGFRLVASGLGIAISLGIWELVALAWPTDHLADNPWYMSTGEALVGDQDLPWVRPPNLNWTGSSRGDLAMETNSPDPDSRIVTFQTDFQGFRNSRDLTEAEVIVVGDSFTEAGNVQEEETFVWRMGRKLDVVTRNLGVAGYTQPSELIVLQKFGLPCQPRTVIWQVAETNDLDDAMFFVQWQQEGRPTVLPGFSKSKPTQLEAWLRRSPTHRLYDLLHNDESWPFRGDFRDDEGRTHTVRFEMAFPANASEHPGWPIVEYSLAVGAQLLKEKNIQLVVMLVPTKLRVMAPVTDFHEIQLSTEDRPLTVKHTLPSGWDLNPEERLATHLQNLCDRLEVPFVDTTTVLAEHAAQGELVYQTMDTHLSPVGHEIVADLLSTTLDNLETP